MALTSGFRGMDQGRQGGREGHGGGDGSEVNKKNGEITE